MQNDNKFSYISKDVGPGYLSKSVLSILSLSGSLDEKLSKEQKVGLRNFFVQSASLSSKPCCGVTSLKALSLIGSDIPAVRLAGDQKKTVSISDSTKVVKFELVDAYGKPFTKTDGLKVSVADLSDNKATLKDVTSQVKLSNSIAAWAIDAKQHIGRYQLVFSLNGYTVSAPTVTLFDKIKLSAVQYSVVQKSSFPSKFDGKTEYPKTIDNIRQGQDDYFIHLAVDASFTKSSEKPSQVFFSLRRKSSEKSLSVNSYGKLNKESGLYEVSVDISKDFDQHFNGDYEISVHAADYRADAPVSWNLGTIKIWYKEGLEQGSYNGIQATYKPLPTIDFTYPPEVPQISPVLPLVGSAILFIAFFKYISHLFGAGRANFSRLSFWGVLFSLNLLLILVIFTAFFIEVKLIPTLWLLLFISPVSLFIAQRALS